MKAFIFTSIMFCTSLMYSQEIKLSFHPTITEDSVIVELVIEGDNSSELGSSNFVYTIEGDALSLSSATDVMPLYSPESYSIWSYTHHTNFEHVLLSRTHKPESLLKINKLILGKVTYPILDKCNRVSLNWETTKGDVRSYKKSIKKKIEFVDTTFLLVDPVQTPTVFEGESSNVLTVANNNNHTVKWYKDEVFVTEGNEVNTNETGVYYATVSNGCEVKESKQFVIENITADDNQKEIITSTLFPNPVKETAILSIDETKLDKIEKVIVVNSEGKEIQELPINSLSSKTILKVSTWDISQGIYYVKIVYSENSEIIRFIY